MIATTYLPVVLTTILSLASAQNATVETGAQGNAPIVSGQPAGVSYVATLPDKSFSNTSTGTNVKGSISATAGPGGVGVHYEVAFSNLPSSGGPFTYHLHVAPVPADGNCTKALAHLDPYIRGEVTNCDPAHPETCQVGDLSGKFGKISSDPYKASYHDPYSTLIEGTGSFFGNRSFVFHFANKTRISCANFAPATGGYATPTGSHGGNGTGPQSTSTPIFTGSGLKNAVSMASLVGVVAWAFLL